MLHVWSELTLKYVLKTLAFLFFLTFFLYNCLHTSKTYFERKTLESTSQKHFDEGMMYFPTFAICDLSGYKDASKVMLGIEEYLENTFDPNDTIQYVGWIPRYNMKSKVLEIETDVRNTFELFTVTEYLTVDAHYFTFRI